MQLRYSQRRIIKKLQKIKDKKIILKAARKTKLVIYTENIIRI